MTTIEFVQIENDAANRAEKVLLLLHDECYGDIIEALAALFLAAAVLGRTQGLSKTVMREGLNAAYHDVINRSCK